MSNQSNGISPEGQVSQLSIALPRSPGLAVHVHLSVLPKVLTIFLTSTALDAGQTGASMGSLVHAFPDVCAFLLRVSCLTALQRYNPNQPLTTTLYSTPASIDFATRMAKIITRRTGKPCHVGNSINLSGAPGGGDLNEEMGFFQAIAQAVIERAT